MMETESVIRKAAAWCLKTWCQRGQTWGSQFTRLSPSHADNYLYAKTTTPFSDGLLSRGLDMHDCTATLDLMFDQLKNKVNEATRHDDGSEKGHTQKGTHLEAMQAVVKGTKDVKSELYRGLPDHQQEETQAIIATYTQRTDLEWGSNKAGKVVHGLSMQLSTGQEISLPSAEKGKQGAPQGKRKRKTGGDSAEQHEYKKGCQVKGCKWGTPWIKPRGKCEMFCTLHFGELNDGVTLELESGKQWVPPTATGEVPT